MAQSNRFSKLLETGQFRVEEGHALLYGSPVIFTPPRVLVHLQEGLEERMGREGAKEVMEDLGEYQVRTAIEKNKELYHIDEIQKSRIVEFGEQIFSVIGIGNPEFVKVSLEEGYFKVRIHNPVFAEAYREHVGSSETSVCYYLEGLIGYGLSTLFPGEGEKVAEETECVAKGDDYCEFVGSIEDN